MRDLKRFAMILIVVSDVCFVAGIYNPSWFLGLLTVWIGSFPLGAGFLDSDSSTPPLNAESIPSGKPSQNRARYLYTLEH